ncbi:GPI ethanolamine phosphate transferase 3 [Magnaporthiopsis poae ATCC 64411]|uniref:GPI ethanolamine phosphate transferase 3 n=1 Tax=Magnaporthiopsis poae (strain ATCC 64411 / 73-15) TaxID=644358 RepID=A0A0C4DKR1_MAGP6|nr:GPI ethanolamine phosphate transferase 3 [Magnaporthiopsis poae ATCC 64411]
MASATTASPGAKTKNTKQGAAAATLDYKTIAAQFAAAKRAKEAEEARARAAAPGPDGAVSIPSAEELDARARADALRYDFTVPADDEAEFHNALPFLHKTALDRPNNAFLRPFIADPPTSTLQRLKGLTTGTLPTFVDLGSNFAGTAIEEDNLLSQLRGAGRKMVHLGDDTWTSLFPGYFEPNISRAYDSFNVWDLHTVDEGVIEHIFPLMRPERKGDWDVLFGHLLGVDHAGHRYGPAHPAMTAKLRQMDDFVSNLTATIDDDTLLVVMGDHGMDGKGDHGGESDDEVEAALWMYSSRPVFGRTDPSHLAPPQTAKIRPVNQIDLVPTLALLLGIPIPYNSLGQPIEEPFAGALGDAYENLAAVSRVATAGIRRPALGRLPIPGPQAEEAAATAGSNRDPLRRAYDLYSQYQAETLAVCKGLWARFDIPSMAIGIANMILGLLVLLLYISRGSDEDEDDGTAVESPELDLAERKLELEGFADPEAEAASKNVLERKLFLAALAGAVPGAAVGLTALLYLGVATWQVAVGAAAAASIVAVIAALFGVGKKTLTRLLPTSFWGWYSVVVVVSQSIGFASNSYTIWEDSITLFFLATFGLAAGISAMRLPGLTERTLGVYHAVLFVVLGRLASLSKLCREEQMPYCTSTYYASATSSTSAPWQLAIPLIVFLALPSVIKGYLVPSRSYEGLAPTWIGSIFRIALGMICLYWTLDAADNGGWLPASAGLPEGILKTLSVYLAQLTLAVAVVAGSTAFIWAPPCVSILTSADPRSPGRAQITVLGYGNAHGARYLLLPINMLAALLLVTKPVGQGALALMLWQLLSLVEMLDLNNLGPGSSSVGPTVLALLASFHFFKTGHQAALSSIQWDAAFVPLFSIRYPWSPLLVALNTFAPHFS